MVSRDIITIRPLRRYLHRSNAAQQCTNHSLVYYPSFERTHLFSMTTHELVFIDTLRVCRDRIVHADNRRDWRMNENDVVRRRRHSWRTTKVNEQSGRIDLISIHRGINWILRVERAESIDGKRTFVVDSFDSLLLALVDFLMKYILCSFLIGVVFVSTTDALCLNFPQAQVHNNSNHCEMEFSNTSLFEKCLRCYLEHPGIDSITLDDDCSPVANLACVEIYFNDTESMQTFGHRYSSLINRMFRRHDPTPTQVRNTLIIHVAHDTLEELTYDLFRSFDALVNRSYQVLGLTLNNRGDRLTLRINPDVNNINVSSMQLNIYCGDKGLYQYNHVLASSKHRIRSELKCEIPPPRTRSPDPERRTSSERVSSTVVPSTTVAMDQDSPEKKRQRRVILISCFASIGSLLPCLLLAYCFYLCYRRRAEDNYSLHDGSGSSISSRSESVQSYDSFSSEARMEYTRWFSFRRAIRFPWWLVCFFGFFRSMIFSWLMPIVYNSLTTHRRTSVRSERS